MSSKNHTEGRACQVPREMAYLELISLTALSVLSLYENNFFCQKYFLYINYKGTSTLNG